MFSDQNRITADSNFKFSFHLLHRTTGLESPIPNPNPNPNPNPSKPNPSTQSNRNETKHKNKIKAAVDDDDDDDDDRGRAQTTITPSRTTAVTAFDSTKKEPSYEAPGRREPDDNNDDADNTLDAAAVALSKLRRITDKYLECPTLLDLFFEMMVQRLSLPASISPTTTRTR